MIDLYGENWMEIHLYDKDTITSDDLIGKCLIPLQIFFANGKYDDSLPVEFQGLPVGMIYFKGKFIPDQKSL